MIRGWWRKLIELRPIPVIDLVTLVVAVLGFWFLWYELNWVKNIARSQNNITLTQGFFHDQTNRGIMDAIYDNKPILKKSGGTHTWAQPRPLMSLTHSSDFASSSMLCPFCIGFSAGLPINLALTVSRMMRATSLSFW